MLLNLWSKLRIFLAKIGVLHTIRQSFLWRFKNRNLYKNFHENALKAFLKVTNITKENDIELWPEFGTLLGIERENGFISHDLDLDFGVLFNQDIQNLIRKEFSKNNFLLLTTTTLKSSNKLIAEKYNFEGVEVDIYYFFEENGNYINYDLETTSGLSIEEEQGEGSKVVPYKNIFTKFKLKRRFFNEIEILFPENIEQHLTELYGENYLIPDPKWNQDKREARYLVEDDEVILEIHRN